MVNYVIILPLKLLDPRGSIQGIAEVKGLPGDPVIKNPPENAGDVGLIAGSGRSPGGGHANTL